MNVSRTTAICMISLMTLTSGLSVVQAMNSDTSRVLVVNPVTENKIFENDILQPPLTHSVLVSYEPPPDIGSPKRTGGSGGRYI